MSISLTKGVELHVIPTTKYKTVRMMVRFASPLLAETISKRTLLGSLLETNSQKYPTQTKLSEKLADLYGASFGANVTKKGDNHYFTISLNVVNDKFLPNEAPVLVEAVAFLKEIIFHPNLTGGAFEQGTFEREQRNLQEYINSVFDDKQSHAALALQELYFQGAPQQKMPSFGTVAGVKGETAESLAQYYKEMLAEDDVTIFVIGDVVEAEITELFSQLPFTPRKTEQQQAFYQQAVTTEIVEKVEKLAVTQSKFNLAYQTGIYFHGKDYFPLQLFNGLFGGFPHSKLFMNVREKESMAYYASSSLDTFRGMLTVQTGIDGRNKERVSQLISEQLASLVAGEISQEALDQTKEMLKNQYLLSLDNSGAVIESAYITSKFEEGALTTEEWLKAVDDVEIKDIQRVAAQVKLQAVYFMEGGQA